MSLWNKVAKAKGQGKFEDGEFFTPGKYVTELRSIKTFSQQQTGKEFIKATFVVHETLEGDDNSAQPGDVRVYLVNPQHAAALSALKSLLGVCIGADPHAEEGEEGYLTDKEWINAGDNASAGEGDSLAGSAVVVRAIEKETRVNKKRITALYFDAPDESMVTFGSEDRASA